MEASGEAGQRGHRQEAQGAGEVRWGGKLQGNKEGPLKPAYFPLRPDIWDSVGNLRAGVGRRAESESPPAPTAKGSLHCLHNSCFEGSPFLPLGHLLVLRSHLPALSQHLLLQILSFPQGPSVPLTFLSEEKVVRNKEGTRHVRYTQRGQCTLPNVFLCVRVPPCLFQHPVPFHTQSTLQTSSTARPPPQHTSVPLPLLCSLRSGLAGRKRHTPVRLPFHRPLQPLLFSPPSPFSQVPHLLPNTSRTHLPGG